jgi:hypothetical protein
MTRNQELELVTRAAQCLQKARESARTSEIELSHAQQALAALAALCLPSVPVLAPDPHARIALANGRRLVENEARTLDEDNYDLILDMTASTLRYRGDPQGHSPLRAASLQGIGPYRTKILALLMEHPDVPMCMETVDDLLGETRKVTEQASFTKSISVLRQALGGGGRRNPYIESVPAWESSRSNNACAYQLNPQWKYLLVKQEKFRRS